MNESQYNFIYVYNRIWISTGIFYNRQWDNVKSIELPIKPSLFKLKLEYKSRTLPILCIYSVYKYNRSEQLCAY